MTGALGTAAFAAPDDDRTAPIGDFTAFAQEKLAASAQVAAVMPSDDGKVVAYVVAPKDGESDDAVVTALKNNKNVEITVLDEAFTAYADTDIVGGAGYFTSPTLTSSSGGLCSVGFSGWSPEGDPAIISAGHCTSDNTNLVSQLTLPTGDPAGGGDPENTDVAVTYPVGELAFSQYGGPGNTGGTAGSTTSVDISVYDVLNADLTTLPEVTNWTTAASEDLSAATIPVRSVGDAVEGPIAKSGRTTGFTQGTVLETKGWANVGGRLVYGFAAALDSAEGDSGGALIQGNTAVGVLSGGGPAADGTEITIGADLKAGLALAGGYAVALYLDAPVVTQPTNGQVYTGAPITGTAPAGSTLEVTPSAGAPFTVPVDGSGNWSFAAPNELGEVTYTLVAARGYDRSDATTLAVEAVLGAPAITSPFDGQIVETNVPVISGTGFPGATVSLTGAVTGEALVAESGLWSIETNGLSYGAYSLSATQSVEGEPVSPAAVSTFQVVAVAPIITSPVGGTTYDAGSAPTQVTGTGIAGASVVIYVNGNSAGTVVVAENGTWAQPFSAALAAGNYDISAAQVINGVGGTVATVSIAVAAAGGSVPAGGPGLANTGNPAMPMIGGGALALLLAAGGVLLMVRRNQTTAADRRS